MDWKSLVKNIAPVLGTALGGPMAGTAIKVLSQKLLGSEEPSEAGVADFIMGASPEQLKDLRQIDADFKIQMEQLGVDVFSLEVADRSNARDNHKDSITPAIMLYILTLLVALICSGLFLFEIPQENKSTLYMVVGQVMVAWIGAMAYWYGTTRGSSDKNKLLTKGAL
jgi:membrane-bound ClpP family serine protease